MTEHYFSHQQKVVYNLMDHPVDHSDTPERKVKKNSRNSAIWEYYTKRDELTVVCNSCQREMKYHGNNTTLIRHGCQMAIHRFLDRMCLALRA